MLRKRDYEAELAKRMAELKKRQDHTKDELDAFGRDIPIRVMQNPFALVKYCCDQNMSFVDTYIIIAWVETQFPFLNDIKVSNDITYDDACKAYDQARVNTIILHRVNYVLHDNMSVVYDLLEKDKRFRFQVKKAYKDAEGLWSGYIKEHRRGVEDAAWYTMLHHLGIVSEFMHPYLEKVYEAVRDNMITLGIRDVELRARAVVVFLMGKVAGHSFGRFFADYEKACGIDFSACFAYDNPARMVARFADMCTLLGIETEEDQYGYMTLKGYNPEDCLRFRSAWAKFINALRDDDLMDDAAKEAIKNNPQVQKEYQKVIEQQQQDMYDESVKKLGEKYKLKTL